MMKKLVNQNETESKEKESNETMKEYNSLVNS